MRLLPSAAGTGARQAGPHKHSRHASGHKVFYTRMLADTARLLGEGQAVSILSPLDTEKAFDSNIIKRYAALSHLRFAHTLEPKEEEK